MTGLVPVPTLPELHKRGLAEIVGTTGGTFYRTTPEGQAEIDAAMLHNGTYLRTHPEESAAQTRAAILAAKAAGGTRKKK